MLRLAVEQARRDYLNLMDVGKFDVDCRPYDDSENSLVTREHSRTYTNIVAQIVSDINSRRERCYLRIICDIHRRS